MKKLNEMLKSNGIEEVEHNPMDDKFGGNPIEALDDLFNAFGRIFAPISRNTSETKLGSGAITRIRNNEGRIFVDSPMRLHKEYSETFNPIKNK